LIRSITIDEPGTYNFSCRYANGNSRPEIVLAVGPNLAWEFVNIAAKSIATGAVGLAVLFGSGLIAVFVALAIAFKRRRSQQAAGGSQSARTYSNVN
jgi:hypothetical protein